jgi:hypothetical protein
MPLLDELKRNVSVKVNHIKGQVTYESWTYRDSFRDYPPTINAFRADDLEKSNLNPWYGSFINIQRRYFTSTDVDPERRACVYVYRGEGGTSWDAPSLGPAVDCGKSIALRAPQKWVWCLAEWRLQIWALNPLPLLLHVL